MIDRARLGSTSGFVSVGIWIVVYSPQIWECFTLQSGEGLSVTFLVIWLFGDLTGLAGALVQQLNLTVSVLAFYYTLCDSLLLYLLFYYRRKRTLRPDSFTKTGRSSSSERTPLLNENGHFAASSEQHTNILQILGNWARMHVVALVAYSLAVVFVLCLGIVGWFVSARLSSASQPRQDEVWSTSGQVVGWISAGLYLGSRIPQIKKNRSTKCQGLSLMMFCFSVLGNITYCGSILLPSTSPSHVWINLSWLVGSAGTILLDFVVLGQFSYYRKDRSRHVYIKGGEGSNQISGL
ncbi:MAG: hypothetical protein CYPHOPRED_001206 [Cyphobasidiales sp. Tagirdzhanova-0007]|nr:MAG: hypothetical protein CYPHOPRED_001206 [Cyphobasidiales sp. Tagirdzhanova-0007]